MAQKKPVDYVEKWSNKILKGQKIDIPKGMDAGYAKDVMKEARKYAKRIQSYKQQTGLSRVSKDARGALRKYTAKQVAGSRGITPKKLERRINAYEKRYGAATLQAIMDLAFATPAAVHKQEGLNGGVVGTNDSDAWVKADIPNDIMITWNDLTWDIRHLKRAHGSFIYENQWIFFGMSQFPFPSMLNDLVDGDDMSVRTFARLMAHKINGVEYFDGPSIWEWGVVAPEELDNIASVKKDFQRNRLYRPKTWRGVDKSKIVYD